MLTGKRSAPPPRTVPPAVWEFVLCAVSGVVLKAAQTVAPSAARTRTGAETRFSVRQAALSRVGQDAFQTAFLTVLGVALRVTFQAGRKGVNEVGDTSVLDVGDAVGIFGN